jgi:hypothetical protein
MLREEQILRVFVNRALRGIMGPKRDEVTGGWKKLHSEELHNLYSSPNIIRVFKSKRMEIGEACNVYGVSRKMRTIFV